MESKKSMKLSSRLTLSFGAVVVLMLAMSAFAWRQMEVLSELTEKLYKHPMAVSTGILAVEGDMVRMHRSMKDVALSQTPEAVSKAKATVDKYEGEARENMKLIKERFLGPKKLVDDIEVCFAEWTPIRERVIALTSEGRKEEAAAITKAEGAAKVVRIEAAIAALHDWAVRRGEAFYDDAQKTKSQAIKTFVAITLAAVLLAAGLAFMLIRNVLRQLGADPDVAAEMVGAVADGNLSLPIPVREGDTTSLLARIRDMQTNLARVVGSVRGNADSVASASAQIAQGNLDLSQRTEQQASALEETAASMEELGSTVKQNADNARQANQLALNASEVAIRGGEVVGQVVDTMKGINDSSKKIADIIGVIDGIAFQTNILALNAAVEAARAGEQGRGFAVVASEVRSLAQRSAEAAKEIKGLIGASVERVEQGAALVDQAGATMTEVVDSIKRVTDIMGEISAASIEQSTGVAQVGEAVTQMDQATQQNAALVEESAAAAESLRTQAQTLVQAVAVFKIAAAFEQRQSGMPAAAGAGWQRAGTTKPKDAANWLDLRAQAA